MAKLPSGCSTEIIRQLFEDEGAHNAVDYMRAERMNERTNEQKKRRDVFFTYLAAKFYDAKISTDGGTHLCARLYASYRHSQGKRMEVENPKSTKILNDSPSSSILPACFSSKMSLRQIPQMEICSPFRKR